MTSIRYIKTKSIILAAIVSTVCLQISYAETNVEKYKQIYVEQIKPILKKQFSGALDKETDPEAKLQFVAEGMADCQIETIRAYPQKYQDASINLVAEGEGLTESTKKVNAMMKADIENGVITEEEFKAMVENATKKYVYCTKALEKQL